eukprot:m.30957 g.30957  ORF g.30957 m.30957 type:complete len:89 (-) comp9278_c0_seq1:195-461(-)
MAGCLFEMMDGFVWSVALFCCVWVLYAALDWCVVLDIQPLGLVVFFFSFAPGVCLLACLELLYIFLIFCIPLSLSLSPLLLTCLGVPC